MKVDYLFLDKFINNSSDSPSLSFLWFYSTHYNYYFPAFSKLFESIIGAKFYEASFFGQDSIQGKKKYGAPHYRLLKKKFNKDNSGNYVMPE